MKRLNLLGRGILFIVVLLFLLSLFGMSCSAQSYQDYAPVLYFEGEETCYPVSADYHIDNSDFYQFTESGSTLVDSTPTGSELSDYSTSSLTSGVSPYSYLDNVLGTVDDTSIIEDYQSKESSLGYTVYYHEYTDGSNTIIQYWMFYAFNQGEMNQHEGDWEMVQVVIPAGSAKWVAYSQHYSGQQATWEQVEKDGDHIKVYVARGSHANYLRSFSGKLGMASDIVGANGKILKPEDYTLLNLETQDWIDYDGRWGDFGGIEDVPLGRVGPEGPKYRVDMNGNNMWDGLTWAGNVPMANDLLFMGEWFIYNFVTIFIALTVVSLLLIIFFIYRRHKKHGLGPRKLSMLYIDGFNTWSIGNILCFVGIIVAIIGLLYPWYTVSADIGVSGVSVAGKADIISIDGINGVQITIPGVTGSIPMGTVLIPFSIIIGITLVFLFLACIGVNRSRSLGFKYIGRGIRLLIPMIILLAVIAFIFSLIPSDLITAGGGASSSYVGQILGALSSSPFGGQSTVTVAESGFTGQIGLAWGLGTGLLMLITGSIILIVAGVLEVIGNRMFFIPRGSMMKQPKGYQPPQAPQIPPQQPPRQPPVQQPPPKKPAGKNFCPKCGAQLPPGAKFCDKCGNKM
jgi:hypothetical protein